MSLRSSLLLLLAAAGITTTNAAGKGYYRASVVGYEVPQNNNNLSPQQNLMANVRNYEQFLKIAQQQAADIIVFPEGGLLGSNYSLFLTIPDPALKIIPNNANYDESILTLSGYAKTYSMYIAVNVHENYTDPSSKKTFLYNTNIVFDRSGAIIARYRKYNLYGEPLDRPEKPEYSYFTTDFGVKFGQFICFDILFREPALTLITKYNVYDFIYPSKWYSELPFLTSVQSQWSWAVGNNVNLLSAGDVKIANGHVGSGIFRGKNALNNLYSFTDHYGSTIMIGDVPIRGQTTDLSVRADYSSQNYTGEESLSLYQQPGMDQFINENIALPANQTSANFNKTICHDKLCCDFRLTAQYVNPVSNVQYKAVVFNGKRKFGATGKEEFGLQVCGVVLCSNESISSCGLPAVGGVLPHYNNTIPKVTFTAINITGNFDYHDSNPLPDVLLWPSHPDLSSTPGNLLINPNEVNFNSNDTMSSLVVNTQNQIMTVAIHSRVFSRDSGNGAYMTSVSMLAMIMSMLPLFMRYM